MWIAVAVAAWIAVGFVFSWLWGTFARFSQSESEDVYVSEPGTDEAGPSSASEIRDPALPSRPSRGNHT